jgi:DNA-binding IclR family transcriptional regulator
MEEEGNEVTKILMVQGEGEELEALRALAIEVGLSVYWVREKSKAKPSRVQRQAHGHLPKAETRLGKLMLATMRAKPFREWTSEELGIALEEHDYRFNSVSPIMTYIEREGLVTRLAPGIFKLTAAGRGDIKACAGGGSSA